MTTFDDVPLARGADIELAAADLRRQLSAIARLTEERDALLAACKAVYEHLGGPFQQAEDDQICLQLHSLIAKAEGESNA